MVTSVNTEKALDKIQHPFLMTKKFNNLIIEGNYVHIIEVTCKKKTSESNQ